MALRIFRRSGDHVLNCDDNAYLVQAPEMAVELRKLLSSFLGLMLQK